METGEFQLPTDGLDTGGQDVELDLQRSSKHLVRIGGFLMFNIISDIKGLANNR